MVPFKITVIAILLLNLKLVSCREFEASPKLAPSEMVSYLQTYHLLQKEFINILENAESLAPNQPRISEECSDLFKAFTDDLQGPRLWSLVSESIVQIYLISFVFKNDYF